jgi:alpha-beta hydrolase superfamily lysophospholipase/SAM-dependent methyltransferase
MVHTTHERTMLSWDGTKLFYRAWLPQKPASRALLVLHRGHEHSGRAADLVTALDLPDVAVFAWDARGHGLSGGERGGGGRFSDYVRDLDTFARTIAEEHGVGLPDMAVLGHSVGAVIAAAWVHDYAPPLRAMVLAAPAFRVRLYVPFAIPALRLLRRLRPGAVVTSYVRPGMLTHAPEEIARYRTDALVTREISAAVLLGLHDASTRLLEDAAAIRVPTLVLTAGSDLVVRRSPQCRFCERLGSPIREHHVYPGFFHSLFHERAAERPIADTRRFLVGTFSRPPVPPSVAYPDVNAAHVEDYQRLLAPLPGWSARRLTYGAMRLLLGTVGRLSEGIRLAHRVGFDAGASLDYVYEDTARGLTPLGRWIDRMYLDSPGWRGIRERRRQLDATLRHAIALVQATARPVHILDIAAGPGRYVLDVLHTLPPGAASAELRDADRTALEAGRARAARSGLANVRFVEGNAFDRAALAAVSPRPTIAIASGLWELFPSNEMVLTSLQGLRDALGVGGYLIYTNQPWHPQLELIARVLRNRQRRPWVMRCRSQAEMNGLARAAGFEPLATRVGEEAIFSVTLARAVSGGV